MASPVLQVALDLLEPDRAVEIAHEAVNGGADWIEAGTPLIKSAGMDIVRRLKAEFPNHVIVADMKIADTGGIEVEMAAKAGAGVVCILAEADDAVIAEAVRAAELYGVRLMGDLLNTAEPVQRAKELEALGVHIINAHVGIDQQMTGKDSLTLLEEIAGSVSVPLGAAGGLTAETAGASVRAGASILLVGSSIIKAADVTEATANVRKAIDDPSVAPLVRQSQEEEIRSIFTSVSTPNISDAMLRKGAMHSLISINPGRKMVGKALPVRTLAGDFAKPVEAIDIASEGDVLVINNERATHVAPWGELATRSCLNRGIAGIVIDGAVRDVDDIRELPIPLFATAIVPNAGEPKGFGEIGAEISCCGQQVVVVPKERAYEIARRSFEVQKTEVRIREEIRRGKTLPEVTELLKWEKK